LNNLSLNILDLVNFYFLTMKSIILILVMIAYVNCTFGLLAALAGGFNRQQPAASHGPIIITSNYESDDSGSAPVYYPIPIPYPVGGYAGYGGYGGYYGGQGGYGHGNHISCSGCK
jgi:hypothetical protein